MAICRLARGSCAGARLEEHFAWEGMRGGRQEAGFDFHRYRQLLAAADDETKRLALIELLIEERAKERLEAQRASDRDAMTASTIARVLGVSRA